MKHPSICTFACCAMIPLLSSCEREPSQAEESVQVESKSVIRPNILPNIPDLPKPVQPIVVSEHEKLADKTMRAMGEFVATAAGVTDLPSAKTAAEKIAGIGDGFAEIAEELQALGIPEAQVRKRISEKMEQHDEEMQKTMGQSLQSVVESLEPDAMEVMQNAVSEFFGKLEAVNAEFERQIDGEEQPTSQ